MKGKDPGFYMCLCGPRNVALTGALHLGTWKTRVVDSATRIHVVWRQALCFCSLHSSLADSAFLSRWRYCQLRAYELLTHLSFVMSWTNEIRIKAAHPLHNSIVQVLLCCISCCQRLRWPQIDIRWNSADITVAKLEVNNHLLAITCSYFICPW